MDKDEMIKSDRIKLMDLLDKLEQGELCTPNCYGCCGDGKLSFAYCPDVTDNFEKELANLGCRIIGDDEIVIKKSEYVALKKAKNDYKQRFESSDKRCEQLVRTSVEAVEKKEQAKKEAVREILQELYIECEYYTHGRTAIEEIAKKYGIELE